MPAIVALSKGALLPRVTECGVWPAFALKRSTSWASSLMTVLGRGAFETQCFIGPHVLSVVSLW